MTSPRFPEPPPSLPPTSLDALDAVVQRVAAKKDAWAQLPILARVALLHQMQEGLQREAAAWAATISQLKGIPEGSPLRGEDWLAGPASTARNIRLLIEALEQNGQPKPAALVQRKSGQWTARVFPANYLEKAAYRGWTIDVWMEPGKEPTQGRIYRDKQEHGTLALVLGAGNVASIGPKDVLSKMFVDNCVCILKMNPVNEVGGPYVERAFKPLIDAGYLAVVYGGGDVGSHLTDHPLVDVIHMTGSDRTHDAILWGPTPAEQEKNKQQKTPRIQKPITSELGCVTPVIVVPGDWSDQDLAFQAKNIAGMVAQNASFNCAAAKVVITWKGWSLRQKLLKKIEEELAATPARKAYYPGAEQRYANFVQKYPNAHVVGTPGEHVVPWTVLPDVPPQKGEYALTQEAFCGVLADTAVEATDVADFMQKAVHFCNDEVWGTLSCIVVIDERTQKQHADRFDWMVEHLRYGGVAINAWSGVLFGLCCSTWGAFPGHPLDNIESGRGVVHNTHMFDHPQKSVAKVPFRVVPAPVWFPVLNNLDELGERLTRFEAAPSLLKLPGLLSAALKN